MKIKDSAGLTSLHPIFAQALAPFVDPDFVSSYWPEPKQGQPAAAGPVSSPIPESISNEIRHL